jgi:hypothetical protein
MAAEIPRVYREFQIKSALAGEKEKNVAARRVALQELQAQAAGASDDCMRRQALVASEQAQVNVAVDEHNAKRVGQEAQLQAQRQQLAALAEQEDRLRRQMQVMEATKAAAVDRVQQARSDSARAPEVDEAIAVMTRKAEEEAAALDAFAAKLAELEAATQSRHAVAGAKMQGVPLTTVPDAAPVAAAGATAPAPAMDDMDGESIMLVGEY